MTKILFTRFWRSNIWKR